MQDGFLQCMMERVLTLTETQWKQMYSLGMDTKSESCLWLSSDGQTTTEKQSEMELAGSWEITLLSDKLGHYKWLTWMVMDSEWRHGLTLTQITWTSKLLVIMLSSSENQLHYDCMVLYETTQQSAKILSSNWHIYGGRWETISPNIYVSF